MLRQQVEEKVKSIIYTSTRGRIDYSILNMNSDLIVEVGIDSIEALQILMMVEEEFNIQIEDENLNRNLLRTIAYLTDYIESKIK